MKRFLFIVLALGFIWLAACSSLQGDSEKSMETATQSPNEQASKAAAKPEATALPATPALSAALPQPELQPDRDIPDVVIDPVQKANSNYTLYEDEDNIYYLWKYKDDSGDVLIINKNDGGITPVARESNFISLYNGKVYFRDIKHGGEVGHIFAIEEYNIKSGVGKSIVTADYPIYEIACFNKKIYYSQESEIILDSGETYDNIYTADISGSNIKKMQENAHSFCFYEDRMFYTSVGGADGGSLNEYDTDNPEKEQEISPFIDWRFDISDGKIVFTDGEEGCYSYDIKTGYKKALPLIYCNIALVGQYAICCERDEHNYTTVLKAYDFLADKEYTLLDISDLAGQYNNIEIHTTRDSIYLCMENYSNNGLEMYKVIIENGQAGLEHIASIDGNDSI